MIYPPEILDRLESIQPRTFDGEVWRHMFGERSPAQVNVRGARWNPPEVGAIYASVERDTALAEGGYAAALQPIHPTVERRLYQLHVRLTSVLDLTDRDLLVELGVDEEALSAVDQMQCQVVGGAVAWLGHDGLLVPSARGAGANLAIYVANAAGDEWGPEIRSSEVVREG